MDEDIYLITKKERSITRNIFKYITFPIRGNQNKGANAKERIINNCFILFNNILKFFLVKISLLIPLKINTITNQ